MILRRERSLKNNVYSTKTSFVDYGKKDVSGAIDKSIAAEEAKIIDDFGAPKLSVGGWFFATVSAANNEVTIEKIFDKKEDYDLEVPGNGIAKVDFVLAMNEVNLDNTFSAALSINANSTKEILDNGTVLLTAEQVAEAKCKIFEKIIQDRAENKIKEYKAKLTDFETAFDDEANFEEFEIPVI